MKKIKDWLKDSLSKLWEGMVKNIGVIIAASIFSGGYLVIINTMEKVKDWINNIPTIWIFTPLLLLLVVSSVLLRIAYTQRLRLTRFEKPTVLKGEEAEFVTHCGVWWHVYRDAGYIEDFPYCACCEARRKLVQTEWYPDETFRCSNTGTVYKLYDGVPRKRQEILDSLYSSYFTDVGLELLKYLSGEANRLKDLYPNISDKGLLDKIFSQSPLSKIPEKDRIEILSRYSKPGDVFGFLARFYKKYRRHLEAKNDHKDQSKQ